MTVRQTRDGTTARGDRRRRRSFGIAIIVAVAALVTWAAWAAVGRRGVAVDESGQVTVLEHLRGTRARHWAAYDHRVRLPDGTEATMRFGELFPVGSTMYVSYRRWPKTNRIRVTVYAPSGPVPPAAK